MKIITIIDFVMITKKRQAYQPIIFNISYFTQKTGYTIFLFEPFRTKNYLKEVDYKKGKNFVILFKRYEKFALNNFEICSNTFSFKIFSCYTLYFLFKTLLQSFSTF